MVPSTAPGRRLEEELQIRCDQIEQLREQHSLQDYTAKRAKEVIDYLRQNESHLWDVIKDPVKRITDREASRSLANYFQAAFSATSGLDLKNMKADVQSVARVEHLLKRMDKESQTIVDVTKSIKTCQPDLWDALLLREEGRVEAPNWERFYALRSYIKSAYPTLSRSEMTNVLFGVRLIAHVIALNLLEIEEL